MEKKNEFLNLISTSGEVWKSVNYVDNISGEVIVDDYHFVSNMGRVVSFLTVNPKVLTPQIQNAGYSIIKVAGKWRTLHRIVAHMFVEQNGKKQVDHINRDKQDNRAVNLRWVNRGENRKNSSPRRSMEQIIADGSSGIATKVNENSDNMKKVYVYDISGKLLITYPSISIASKETLGSYQEISRCMSGKKLMYRGVIWLGDNNIWERLVAIRNNFNNKRKYEIKEYQAEKIIIPAIDSSVRLC